MKITVMICLLMLSVSMTQTGASTGAFEPATRIGAASETSFFTFSTSVGNYTLRHDGFCEVSVKGKRPTFWLKVGRRAERVYFYEYEGDLVLLSEGSDKTGYLSRVNQRTRKTRWVTPVKGSNIGPPRVEGDTAYFGAADVLAKVDLKTGAYLNDVLP
jgi:hypothetical protein